MLHHEHAELWPLQLRHGSVVELRVRGAGQPGLRCRCCARHHHHRQAASVAADGDRSGHTGLVVSGHGQQGPAVIRPCASRLSLGRSALLS